RRDHQVGRQLPGDVGAEADGLQLDELVENVVGDIPQFQIPAAQSAFAEETLGDRVQAEQRHRIDTQRVHHLGERVEPAPGRIDVLLVNFVGNHRQAVACG